MECFDFKETIQHISHFFSLGKHHLQRLKLWAEVVLSTSTCFQLVDLPSCAKMAEEAPVPVYKGAQRTEGSCNLNVIGVILVSVMETQLQLAQGAIDSHNRPRVRKPHWPWGWTRALDSFSLCIPCLRVDRSLSYVRSRPGCSTRHLLATCGILTHSFPLIPRKSGETLLEPRYVGS